MPVPPEPAIDDASARELRLALVEAIATLRERDRIAVSLRYVSGLSYEEMADFLAVPVSTVKKRLHDARKRLRTQLESVAVARVPREWRPSNSPRLEKQVAQLTALLDSVARGDLALVKAMLDAHPQYFGALVKLLLSRGVQPDVFAAAALGDSAHARTRGRGRLARHAHDG